MTGSIETLIVAGSPVTDPASYESVVRNASRLVAVDRGADLALALNRTPDVVIGNLDSISEQGVESLRSLDVEFVELPVDKDVTHLDAALDLCRARDWSAPVITAAFGGRPDHGIAVLGSLARGADLNVLVQEPSFRGWVLSPGNLSGLEIEGSGRVFSVFALLGDAAVTNSPVYAIHSPARSLRLSPRAGSATSSRKRLGASSSIAA